MKEKDPLEPGLSRRRFLVGAIAAAGAAVVVKPDPVVEAKRRPPGTRWIGHI